jgi:catechol 2,3-dioxygenase-like lactoylglutathione lyase family enzyme
VTIRLHHVQVACPPGGEAASRRFYVDGLGLTEVEKPDDLKGRGGAWFRAYGEHGAVTAELHVGVEDPFVPAGRAHPAFVVDDLEATADAVRAVGGAVDRSQQASFDGYRRFHVRDPHGNRVEVLQSLAG